ncbi:MAG: hypothetical protein L0H25_01740 [Micrococcales bacterium]|nr:hypothetical protein [Micrococcales bacterium]
MLDRLVIVSGVLAVTLVALVIEDALPIAPGERFDARRGLALLAAVLLAVGLGWWSARLRGKDGTLYVIRYLEEWMDDWHQKELIDDHKGRLDVRAITRTAPALPEDGVWDVTADLEQMSRDLQMAMNDDDSSSGFHLAPNLLWMAGISLGYQLYADWDNVTLEEYADRRDSSPHVDDSFTWRLTPNDDAARGRPLTLRSQMADHAPCGTVLVTFDLTDPGEGRLVHPTKPTQWCADRWYRVAAFPEDSEGVDMPSRPVLVATEKGRVDEQRAVTEPWTATRVCVAALRQALHENPDATILVAARLPKSISVAVGWWLMNCTRKHHPGCGISGCRQESCRHPWSRLVPLHFDGATNTYRLTRVHRGQPHVGVLGSSLQETAS